MGGACDGHNPCFRGHVQIRAAGPEIHGQSRQDPGAQRPILQGLQGHALELAVLVNPIHRLDRRLHGHPA